MSRIAMLCGNVSWIAGLGSGFEVTAPHTAHGVVVDGFHRGGAVSGNEVTSDLRGIGSIPAGGGDLAVVTIDFEETAVEEDSKMQRLTGLTRERAGNDFIEGD